MTISPRKWPVTCLGSGTAEKGRHKRVDLGARLSNGRTGEVDPVVAWSRYSAWAVAEKRKALETLIYSNRRILEGWCAGGIKAYDAQRGKQAGDWGRRQRQLTRLVFAR